MIRTIRRNYTMPSDWAEAFSEEAARRGVTISEFVRMSCRAKLPRDVREKLSEPTPVGKPEGGWQ